MSNPKSNPMAEAISRKKAKSDEAEGGGVARTFREVTEATPTKKTTFDLPVEVHRALRWEALRRDATMRDVVLRYVLDGMEKDGITPSAEA